MEDVRTLHEGEELVRRILDAVPGGVVHVRKDGSIESANREALRILGYRYDQLTKRFISDFDPETIREDGSACPVDDYPVARALATGKPAGPTTIGVRRPDQEIFWAVFRALPMLDADGAVAGAIVTFLDVTERKRTEDALRRSEAKWRSLAESLPDFVVVTDRDARIQSINRVLPEFELDKVIGSDACSYIDAADVEEWRRQFAIARDERRTTRFETRAMGPNGRVAWYESLFVPLSIGDVVDRVMVVARDVTERRAILASLAERERLASVGMVAASVAHEIMNPLTYVLANLDLALSRREDQALLRRALESAREGANRMQQIVWDLRALGRAGSEELFYVDVRSVLETALRLSGLAANKTARVVCDLQEVPGVLASESRLCQVFINLLVNAAQSMEDKPAAEREIRLHTRHDAAADLVAVDVSDRGSGVAPEDRERIFEPFHTTKPSGTGLGLSISRDILARMGGRLEVTSELGVGSTFTVWLSTTRGAPLSSSR